MGYSENDSIVRVSVFKHNGGKWSHDLAVDMGKYYCEPIIHDALIKSLQDHDDGRSMSNYMDGCSFICLEPCHKNSHPIILRNREAQGL